MTQKELDYFRKPGMNRAKLLLPSTITMIICGVLYNACHVACLIVYFIAIAVLCDNVWYLLSIDDINADEDRKAWHEAMKRIYQNETH